MGRRSKGRSNSSSSSLSIRGMMRGMKNRWGRFQCPRDGSICKSLEAWHWHRHKYHQTDHIDYVELDPDVDDTVDVSRSTSSFHQLPLHPSSFSPERLLPPEAFAPRRQPEIVFFPDDASDLTEPELPVLLSEEVTSPEVETPPVVGGAPGAAAVRWEAMEETEEAEEKEKICPPARDQHVVMTTNASRLLGNESQGNRRDMAASHLHDNDSHGNHRQRHYRSRERSLEPTVPPPLGPASSCPAPSRPASSSCPAPSRPASSGPASSCPAPSLPACSSCPASLSSAMDLVAVHVLRILQRDDGSARSAQDIQLDVQSCFSGLGLSREGLEGVVTGTLMGARDQWKNGYNAGWKDGATEILNAPILRSAPLSPPGGIATTCSARNPGQVTLLMTSGQRSRRGIGEDGVAEKIDRSSIETLETSDDQTGNHGNDLRGNDLHGNDLNNNDEVIVPEN